MVCLTVTYIFLPNRDEEAVELLKKLTKLARTEPGCRMFQAHRETKHFDELVQRGLFRILETRTPELYAPLPD